MTRENKFHTNKSILEVFKKLQGKYVTRTTLCRRPYTVEIRKPHLIPYANINDINKITNKTMLHNSIEQWIDKHDNGYKYEDVSYIYGYEKALYDLKSRIPELEEKIVGEIEKYFKNETTLEQKLSFASAKTVRDIINTLKGGKE